FVSACLTPRPDAGTAQHAASDRFLERRFPPGGSAMQGHTIHPVHPEVRMHARFNRITFVLLFLLVPLGLSAQESARIAGTVTSEVGRPLVGAQVFIPGTGIGTLTNESGSFLLLNVTPGTHTLRAQLIGWSTSDRPVTGTAGEAVTSKVQLRESAIALDGGVGAGAGQ